MSLAPPHMLVVMIFILGASSHCLAQKGDRPGSREVAQQVRQHLRQQKSALQQQLKQPLVFTFRDLKTGDEKRVSGTFSLNTVYKTIASGDELSREAKTFYQQRLKELTKSVNSNGRKLLEGQSVQCKVLYSAVNKRLEDVFETELDLDDYPTIGMDLLQAALDSFFSEVGSPDLEISGSLPLVSRADLLSRFTVYFDEWVISLLKQFDPRAAISALEADPNLLADGESREEYLSRCCGRPVIPVVAKPEKQQVSTLSILDPDFRATTVPGSLDPWRFIRIPESQDALDELLESGSAFTPESRPWWGSAVYLPGVEAEWAEFFDDLFGDLGWVEKVWPPGD